RWHYCRALLNQVKVSPMVSPSSGIVSSLPDFPNELLHRSERAPAYISSPSGPAALVDPTVIAQVRRPRNRLPRSVQRLLGPVLLLAGWQVISSLQFFDPRTTPAPWTVVHTAWTLLVSGELQTHLWASLQRVVAGLALGLGI